MTVRQRAEEIVKQHYIAPQHSQGFVDQTPKLVEMVEHLLNQVAAAEKRYADHMWEHSQ